MGKSWEDALKRYLAQMNQTYVDGKIERLVQYFAEPTAMHLESEQWKREREKLLAQGVKPLAARTKVVPIQVEMHGEDEVEVSLSMQHFLQYSEGEKSYSEEKQRLQSVRMRRTGEDWLFSGPWSFALEQHKRETTDYRQAREGNRAKEGNRASEGIQGSERIQASGGNKAGDAIIASGDVQTSDDESNEKALVNGAGRHATGLEDGTETISTGENKPGTDTSSVKEAAYGGRYNRERAAAYAERYWNSYNPAYIHFEVDCTSFVSQCMFAGGIPMISTGNRNSGWWYRHGAKPDWSYSWAVAHSLYLLLKSGKAPFHAAQVQEADQLDIGDIICYDFDGNGRFQHNTIVVAKDENGMPLVDAHTYDSSMRYWEYTDSSAYTPNIKYGFFHIQA